MSSHVSHVLIVVSWQTTCSEVERQSARWSSCMGGSPGLWSLCHLCDKSGCFLSAQSSAAASSSPKTSAVSSASRPSVASPWTWRSAESLVRAPRLQETHSWIGLPNTNKSLYVTSACHTAWQVKLWHPDQNIRSIEALQSTSSFNLNKYQPVSADCRLVLFSGSWKETAALSWATSCGRCLCSAVIAQQK